MPDLTDVFDLASRANTAEAANVRFALDRALAVLSSGQFLYDTGQAAPAKVADVRALSPWPGAPLPVPLGATSLHPNPMSLPVVALIVDTADRASLQARLSELLVENNARPFCRPLLVTSNLALMPFVGLLGLAVCPTPAALDNEFFTYLRAKYDALTVVSLSTGALLADLAAPRQNLATPQR